MWEAFQARFAIPQILEFYAATEGNFSLYNAEGKPGAIGRIPPFLAHRFPHRHRRIDDDTGAPRAGRRLCIAVARGEAGEAIGKIAGGAARFEGYTDAAATEKKILRDVFKPGDAWVRTGDLMRQDAQGFFYFVDRIGDTFRWKGENVATTEVAAALATSGRVEANVYGVAVPGQMAAPGWRRWKWTDSFDLAGFKAHLATRLPDYARPVFLRIVTVPGDHRDLQAEKAGSGARRFRSRASSPTRSTPICGEGYVPLDADALRADQHRPASASERGVRAAAADAPHGGFPHRSSRRLIRIRDHARHA